MIERRKTDEKALEKRLHFERWISDLSARFMTTPFDQIDNEIHNALKRIMEFFQVDQCGLLEFRENGAFAGVTHTVYSEGVQQVSPETNLVELFPWAYKKLMQGEYINISRLEDYPDHATRDRQTHEAMGTKSVLTIPLTVGGRISRIITIHHTRRHQIWPEDYIPRLRLLGEILANTLEHRQCRLDLEEQLRFEILLSEISGRFINLRADQVDGEIRGAQAKICDCLDLDLCALWQWSLEIPRVVTMTHLYRPLGGPPLPEPMYAHETFPWCQEELEAGRIINVSSMKDLPAEAALDLKTWNYVGTKSCLTIPLSLGGGSIVGALSFNSMLAERAWPEALIGRLRLVAQIFANALTRMQMEYQLRERLQEIERLKEKLEKENVYLREEAKVLLGYNEIVGNSPAIRKVLAEAERVAPTDSTVLIMGETGTGKELLARAIHSMSSRKDRSLVTVNCASLPPTLIESELFGREKGAYTGALTRMTGRFEMADKSTLFLDEIGEMPLELQSKLLRVLEEGVFERLGSTRTIKVNVRVIAATNRDLSQDVAAGKFRKDLYYRLNVFPITIPPLRERKDDIPPLAWAFVRQFEKSLGKHIDRIPKKSMDVLACYSWPGNIRELKNVVEHAMIMSTTTILEILPPAVDRQENADRSCALEDMERRHIIEVLERTNWRISGRNSASEILGMKRTTLQSKMKSLGITRGVS